MMMLLLMQCELLLEREIISTLGNVGCVCNEENAFMFGSLVKLREGKVKQGP